MIDNELLIFNAVATTLRKQFQPIFVSGVELVDTPPQFPAVSIVQTDNKVNERGSTFDYVENVATETYTFNIFSNLENVAEAKAQTKQIASVIDEVMAGLFYPRILCQPIANADSKITRLVARYTKSDVTMEV